MLKEKTKELEISKELIRKIEEEKEYENLSFKVEDLLILEDKREMDKFKHINVFVDYLNMWNQLTKEEARTYYEKLCKTLGNDYKLNFYESYMDDNYKINFTAHKEEEKVIRVTLLNNKYKKEKEEFAIITIDLSDIKNKEGKSIYKKIFNNLRKIEKNQENA